MKAIELVNQQRGENAVETGNTSWSKPSHESSTDLAFAFVHILKLKDFLLKDTLYFYISKVEVQ